jgi:hypothetical protein
MTARRNSRAGPLRAALVSGTFASVASATALVVAGRRELNDAAAPLNGPSQWIWGRHAPYRDGFSLRHTGLGYGIHHLSSIFWAVWFERARPRPPRYGLRAAIATSSFACFVDYCCTPQRLTPGFEKRLSRRALFATYLAFALGLAASGLIRRREKPRRRR